MAIIELDTVSKYYQNGSVTVTALDRASLNIDKGDFVCIAGPSGSGKSTLLHLAGILDKPSKGEIRINGHEMHSLSKTAAAIYRRQNLGFIFQRFNLIPVLTPFENVEYVLSLLNIEVKKRKQRVEQVLEAVGLYNFMHHPAGNLSGGQQQRVAVARAIAASPQIILADEPTSSLDSTTGSALIDLFAEINQTEHTTFLFSSHDPRIIKQANRIVLLKDGKIHKEK